MDESTSNTPVGLGAADLDAAINEHGERIEALSKPHIATAQGVIRRQNRKPWHDDHSAHLGEIAGVLP